MKIPAILVFVAILLLISLAAIDAFAQNAPPAFEVAVVKLNVSGSGNSRNKTVGERGGEAVAIDRHARRGHDFQEQLVTD